MKIAVVGHISRLSAIERLTSTLPCETFIDSVGKGALHNHLRALRWAAEQSDRVVIMEDDAIPVECFVEKAEKWFSLFPDQFISFYLGTGRPPQYQKLIDQSIEASKKVSRQFIWLNQLIHGVCYSPVPGTIHEIIDKIDMNKPADFAIGSAWGKSVYYPIRSLVEHRDGKSVEKHTDGRKKSGVRVARFLDGNLQY